MSSRVRRLTATLGALVAACVTMTSAFAGSAAAGPLNGVPSGITSIPLTKSVADMRRIAEYWSPARLKQAMDNGPATPGVPATPGKIRHHHLAVPQRRKRHHRKCHGRRRRGGRRRDDQDREGHRRDQ